MNVKYETSSCKKPYILPYICCSVYTFINTFIEHYGYIKNLLLICVYIYIYIYIYTYVCAHIYDINIYVDMYINDVTN